MKVKELIKELKKFNENADLNVIVNNMSEEFSLTWSSYDSNDNDMKKDKKNTKRVSFYVDRLCKNEN